jgi:hypothetical protein
MQSSLAEMLWSLYLINYLTYYANFLIPILVRSNVVRQQAHQFYEKVGYIPFKTQLVLHRDLNQQHC